MKKIILLSFLASTILNAEIINIPKMPELKDINQAVLPPKANCESCQEVQKDLSILSCASIDHSKPIPDGTTCKTSKGAIFLRVTRAKFGEAWKGPNGIIWSDVIGDLNFLNAINKCKKLGGRLPEKDNFNHSYQMYNLFEVLPNMKGHWFWTDSISPSGLYFENTTISGDNGHMLGDTRDVKNSVRCIANEP